VHPHLPHPADVALHAQHVLVVVVQQQEILKLLPILGEIIANFATHDVVPCSSIVVQLVRKAAEEAIAIGLHLADDSALVQEDVAELRVVVAVVAAVVVAGSKMMAVAPPSTAASVIRVAVVVIVLLRPFARLASRHG
jgi:hypothetical protein